MGRRDHFDVGRTATFIDFDPEQHDRVSIAGRTYPAVKATAATHYYGDEISTTVVMENGRHVSVTHQPGRQHINVYTSGGQTGVRLGRKDPNRIQAKDAPKVPGLKTDVSYGGLMATMSDERPELVHHVLDHLGRLHSPNPDTLAENRRHQQHLKTVTHVVWNDRRKPPGD